MYEDNVRRKSEYSTVSGVFFYLVVDGEKGFMGLSVDRGGIVWARVPCFFFWGG
jgi:hypothetical protein